MNLFPVVVHTKDPISKQHAVIHTNLRRLHGLTAAGPLQWQKRIYTGQSDRESLASSISHPRTRKRVNLCMPIESYVQIKGWQIGGIKCFLGQELIRRAILLAQRQCFAMHQPPVIRIFDDDACFNVVVSAPFSPVVAKAVGAGCSEVPRANSQCLADLPDLRMT